MAVGAGAARFEGDIILLRIHPRSGASALAGALNVRLCQLTGLQVDLVADLDNLTEARSVTAFFNDVAKHRSLLILKTRQEEAVFAEQYADILPRIRCKLMLFRTPLAVAISTYRYLSGVRGALDEESSRFGRFFSDWVRAGGNAQWFAVSRCSSWEGYAEEAIRPPQQVPCPTLYATYDEVLASPERAANRICGRPEMMAVWTLRGQVPAQTLAAAAPAADNESSPGERNGNYFAAGTFGDLVGSEAYGDLLMEYVERFAPLVNRLIRERSVPVRLL